MGRVRRRLARDPTAPRAHCSLPRLSGRGSRRRTAAGGVTPQQRVWTQTCMGLCSFRRCSTDSRNGRAARPARRLHDERPVHAPRRILRHARRVQERRGRNLPRRAASLSVPSPGERRVLWHGLSCVQLHGRRSPESKDIAAAARIVMDQPRQRRVRRPPRPARTFIGAPYT